MASRLAIFILSVATVPAAGLTVAWLIARHLWTSLALSGPASLFALCSATEGAAAIPSVCAAFGAAKLLALLSLAAAGSAVILPLVFHGASLATRGNRKATALVFPALVKFSVVALSVVVLLQGAVLVFGLYSGESYLTGRIHLMLIALVGVGAVLGACQLIWALVGLTQDLQTSETAILAEPADFPHLAALVGDVARRLGARAPDNIILGLQPNFYAISADVQLDRRPKPKPLTGETLYMSAPLLRVLSKQELKGVIGHELGHFRGEDTVYSTRFAPVYIALVRSLENLDGRHEYFLFGLAKRPAKVILSVLIEIFARQERTIGRVRELEADKAGASVSEPRALISALLKLGLADMVWDEIQEHLMGSLDARNPAANLRSQLNRLGNAGTKAAHVTRTYLARDGAMTLAKVLAEKRTAHPIDTHPTLIERARALNITLNDAARQAVKPILVPEKLLEEISRAEARLGSPFEESWMAFGRFVQTNGIEISNQNPAEA